MRSRDMKEKYVLLAETFDGYFTGHTYIDLHSGERYAVLTDNIKEAEKYSDKETVDIACELLNKTVQNYRFIEEVVEE